MSGLNGECNRAQTRGEALPEKYPGIRLPTKSHKFRSVHFPSQWLRISFQFGYWVHIQIGTVTAETFVCIMNKRILNHHLGTLRIQISVHADSQLLDPGQKTGLHFMGFNPGWTCWPREAGAISFLAAGTLLLNQTAQTHLSGSVQWWTKEIAPVLCAWYLIPHIIYLVARLSGLLLELQNASLLAKYRSCSQIPGNVLPWYQTELVMISVPMDKLSVW